jgi:hypothetical protein
MGFQRLAWLSILPVLLVGASLQAEPTTDLDLAKSALGILGVDFPALHAGRSCAECHDINIYTVRDWINRSGNLMRVCFLTGESLPLADKTDALAMVNCMRTDTKDPQSDFDIKKLGLQAAFVHTGFYKELFKKAFPEDWKAKHADFVQQIGMPKNREPLSLEDVAVVKRWAEKDGPYLEKLLANPEPPQTMCTPFLSDELKQHLEDMRRYGWETKNRSERLRMFACAPGQEKAQCFEQKDTKGNPIFPEARQTEIGKNWLQDFPEAKIRFLRDLPVRTRYWMRTSPDGRFVGNGGSAITDLAPTLRGEPKRDITIAAQYDPEFFSDNSGFMFQDSGPTKSETGFCSKDILTDESVTNIDFTDPRCNAVSGGEVGLYQSVGTDLGTGDYLAVFGEFASNSGVSTDIDEQPSWFDNSYLSLVKLVHDGTSYDPKDHVLKWTPYEGDWSVSPSTRMLISRITGVQNDLRVQLGYNVHLAKPFEEKGRINYLIEHVGAFCQRGGKGRSSFDERMFAYFHYVIPGDFQELGFSSATDPEFLKLLGSSNVYVHDLLTGKTKRVTRMGPNQQALFPHFRSDGWLYFQVWDTELKQRFIVASDASIVFEQKGY